MDVHDGQEAIKDTESCKDEKKQNVVSCDQMPYKSMHKRHKNVRTRGPL